MKKLSRRVEFKDELDSQSELENATTFTNEHFDLINLTAKITESKNARVILLTDKGQKANDHAVSEA